MSRISAIRAFRTWVLLRSRRGAVLGGVLAVAAALLALPSTLRTPFNELAAVAEHLPFVVDRLRPGDIARASTTDRAGDERATPPLILALERMGRGQGTAPGLPAVASTISPSTRTCARGARAGTPTTSAACVTWVGSGPVNVVLIGLDGVDPVAALWATGRWRPADGHWLVADALIAPGAGCTPGWRASRTQFEVRLDRVRRHHVKLITDSCDGPFGAYSLAFGDAHTDLYQPAGCSGDHAVGWDTARDQLVAALQKSRAVAAVVYVQTWQPGSSFAGGCRRQVTTDGRVAYVVLHAPGPGGPRSRL